MLAGLLYFMALAMFGFVIFGAAHIPNDIWLVACIFPAFFALIVGFFMFVFAWGEFGATMCIGSLVVPFVAVRLLRGRLSARGLFIAICGAAVVGLIIARFAFLAADIG